ncbi:hypothetical protein ACO0TC_31105, partial [Pseudomonas aeruginosa]|uniref:hypothetical protein n=1 Tax=Pseudomonas aeruginosa TaxID=287 RepID=UPI003BF24034
TLSETPEGNLKWLAATSTAGTSDRLAAAKATFSTESANSCLSKPAEIAPLRAPPEARLLACLYLD